MGQSDINAWRRQNSDVVAIVLTLVDGTRARGTILQPRDKTLREMFGMSEPFIDFDCAEFGPMVIAKGSIASIRLHQVPAADQLDRKLKGLDKADSHKILGVGKGSSRDEMRAAYVALARAYHPDRFAAVDLPSEVAEYIDAMAQRINGAYAELVPTVRASD
jgi:hypothetical protein